MAKAYITTEQAKTIDIRDYKHLASEYFARWNRPEIAKSKTRATVFNKRSIVFDKVFKFKFEVLDPMDDGNYSVWPFYSIDGRGCHLLCNYLGTEFAETVDEVRDLVVSVLYYIDTRI